MASNKKRSNFKVMLNLAGLVKPLSGYMLLAILMGTLGNLFAIFITVCGGYAILDVAGFDVMFSYKAMFAAAAIFALFRGILRYAEQACNHFIAFKLLALIRDKVFGALRRLCPAKLEGRDRGNLISIITSDIELLEVFYAHTISPIVIAIITTIVMCIFMGRYSIWFGLYALAAYVAVGAVIPFIISKISGDDGAGFREKSGKLSSFVLDTLHGMSEILQYNFGERRIDKMREMTKELSFFEKKLKSVSGRNTAVTNVVILGFDLGMLVLGFYLNIEGKVSFEGVLICVIALFSSFGPVSALAALGSTLQNTFAAGNRVLDLLSEEPVIEEVTGKAAVSFEGAKVEDVSFSYDEEQVLADTNIDIKKGEVLGIVGKSGSGKSTLLKLLMRFWKPESGEISISGCLLEDINTYDLRKMEGYVTQTTHLFCDSIANNLKVAKSDATMEEIEAACKKASVHEFIMSLPKGYDTPVGELGDNLSGGERQRIGLARAFLHDAPCILLDEPTSNLDSLNEGIILKSLTEERDGKTVILVSHRASTMGVADRVISMKQGRVS